MVLAAPPDRFYVDQSPMAVTSRELLPLAVSFASRLDVAEAVAVPAPSTDVVLHERPTGADASLAIVGVSVVSPVVTVTVDFGHPSLVRGRTYTLKVRGACGSMPRREDAWWDLLVK